MAAPPPSYHSHTDSAADSVVPFTSRREAPLSDSAPSKENDSASNPVGRLARHGKEALAAARSASLAKTTKKAEARFVSSFNAFRGEEEPTAEVIIAWLGSEQERGISPNSFHCMFSHVKSYIRLSLGIKIDEAPVYTYIKAVSRHIPKNSSESFSMEQIFRIVETIPDEDSELARKLYILFSFFCAARIEDMVSLRFEQVKIAEKRDGLIISIHRGKTGVDSKKFIPQTNSPLSCPLMLYMRYVALVPNDAERFFLRFGNGKYENRPLGRHTLEAIAKWMANELGLEGKYTSHSFRSSSATAMAENGASIEQIMTAGDWKSPTVARSYVHKSERLARVSSTLMHPPKRRATGLHSPCHIPSQEQSSQLIPFSQGQAPQHQLDSSQHIQDQNVSAARFSAPSLVFKNCTIVGDVIGYHH